MLKYWMEQKQQSLFACLFTVDLNQTEFISFLKNTHKSLLPQLGSWQHTMREDKKSATKYRFFFFHCSNLLKQKDTQAKGGHHL